MITQFRTYKNMPSAYLTDEIFSNMLLGKNVNLINIMLKEEAKQQISFVSEGLSKTYPTNKFIKWAYSFLEHNLPKQLLNIKYNAFDEDSLLYDFSINNNRPLYKQVYYVDRRLNKAINYDKNPDNSENVFGHVIFYIPFFKLANFKDGFLKKLIDDSFIFGYNFSHIEKIKLNVDDVVCYKVQFEAKFPMIQFDLNETLYHITFITNLDKIKKNGLTPKSRSFMFDYPDRIYLFNSDDIKLMLDYIVRKSNNKIFSNEISKYSKEDVNTFCILKIKKQTILNSDLYKSGKLVFYVDGCFHYTDNNAQAVFTYNSIPSKLIDDTCLVYNRNLDNWNNNPSVLKFK